MKGKFFFSLKLSALPMWMQSPDEARARGVQHTCEGERRGPLSGSVIRVVMLLAVFVFCLRFRFAPPSLSTSRAPSLLPHLTSFPRRLSGFLPFLPSLSASTVKSSCCRTAGLLRSLSWLWVWGTSSNSEPVQNPVQKSNKWNNQIRWKSLPHMFPILVYFPLLHTMLGVIFCSLFDYTCLLWSFYDLQVS